MGLTSLTLFMKCFLETPPPTCLRASLVAQMVKNLPAMQETQVHPRVGKIPCRREWLPAPVFLPGEFQGQRSLAGYSPWGRKESDMS